MGWNVDEFGTEYGNMMGTCLDGRNWLGFKDEPFVIGKMEVLEFSY